jgi:hypothetical protein
MKRVADLLAREAQIERKSTVLIDFIRSFILSLGSPFRIEHTPNGRASLV